MKLKQFNELGKKWCVNIYKLELCFDIQFDIKQIDSICSLFKIREVLGLRIATEHNLYFYYQLMKKMREEIIKDNFVDWSEKFISRYQENNDG